MDTDTAAEIASKFGTYVLVASGIITLILFVLLRILWKPKNRYSYALQMTTWPLFIQAVGSGGPIVRSIIGYNSRYGTNLNEFMLGTFGLYMIGFIPLFIIGILILTIDKKSRKNNYIMMYYGKYTVLVF